MGSATAMTACTLLRIDKKSKMHALQHEHKFSDVFVTYLLARNIRYEEDLVDQLFNSSERRLARLLLLLARFGKGRHTGDSNPQDQSANPRRNDRHDAVTGQFFHESVQTVRLR
jgi:CRP-like cAMP-binding protein